MTDATCPRFPLWSAPILRLRQAYLWALETSLPGCTMRRSERKVLREKLNLWILKQTLRSTVCVTTTPIKYYENEMKPNVVSLSTTLRNCPQQWILSPFNSAKTNTNQSVRRITTCNYPQWGYKYFRQIFAATRLLKEIIIAEWSDFKAVLTVVSSTSSWHESLISQKSSLLWINGFFCLQV